VARMGVDRKVYRVLLAKLEGERPLGRPKRRWMGLVWILGRLVGSVEWIQLAQDRERRRAVVNAVMNLRVIAPRS
jgi:hypothetical protein